VRGAGSISASLAKKETIASGGMGRLEGVFSVMVFYTPSSVLRHVFFAVSRPHFACVNLALALGCFSAASALN
jgi:hypothetical protein